MTRNCLFWFVGRRRFIKKLVTTNVTKFLSIWREEFHALAKQFQVTYNIKSDDKIPKNNSFLYRFFCRKLWSHHIIQSMYFFRNVGNTSAIWWKFSSHLRKLPTFLLFLTSNKLKGQCLTCPMMRIIVPFWHKHNLLWKNSLHYVMSHCKQDKNSKSAIQ